MQLFGELDDIDLIKVHIRSGKVTFLECNDWNKTSPSLKYRIKVKLRDLEVDIFNHSDSQQSVDKRLFFANQADGSLTS